MVEHQRSKSSREVQGYDTLGNFGNVISCFLGREFLAAA